MENWEETALKDFVENGYKTYIPHVSVDCVIFGYHDHQLKILLSDIEGMDGYCLPGGYIKRIESLDAAANRIVEEKTSITGLYLQQFKAFGDPERIKWGEYDLDQISKKRPFKKIKSSWLKDQTISIGYYAITDFSLVEPRPGFMSTLCEWYDIDKIPPLMFDHDQMVRDALQTLRSQLYYHPIVEKLLPEKFALTEIHAVYETILGRELHIRNFPQKLLFLELITKLNEKRNIGPHRAPFLYKFNKDKYTEALKAGVTLV